MAKDIWIYLYTIFIYDMCKSVMALVHAEIWYFIFFRLKRMLDSPGSGTSNNFQFFLFIYFSFFAFLFF